MCFSPFDFAYHGELELTKVSFARTMWLSEEGRVRELKSICKGLYERTLEYKLKKLEHKWGWEIINKW